MDTAAINNPVLNGYWNVIKDWSNDMKIALISKISASMVYPAKRSEGKTLGDFFGTMKDDNFPSAKELRDVMSDDIEDVSKYML